MTPSQIGLIVEQKCMAFMLENGFNVLSPIGNYTKYDFVIEYKNNFIRIQCKHSTVRDDCFVMKTHMTDRRGKQAVYSSNDCDYFMTIANGNFYIIPVFEKTERKFWFLPKKRTNCHHAKDYEAETIIEQIKLRCDKAV